MDILDLKNISVEFARALVRVPALGKTKPGEKAPRLLVRELTADERRRVVRDADIRPTAIYFDIALVVFLGTVQGDSVESPEIGDPYFPDLEFIRNLPGGVETDLARLCNEILTLSGFDLGTGAPDSRKNGVETAKKK